MEPLLIYGNYTMTSELIFNVISPGCLITTKKKNAAYTAPPSKKTNIREFKISNRYHMFFMCLPTIHPVCSQNLFLHIPHCLHRVGCCETFSPQEQQYVTLNTCLHWEQVWETDGSVKELILKLYEAQASWIRHVETNLCVNTRKRAFHISTDRQKVWQLQHRTGYWCL